MAYATVNMIGPRAEQQKQEKPKKEAIDYILEGLQVAQGITGIAVNYQTIKSKMGENAVAEDKRQGILPVTEQAEMAKNFDRAPAGAEGATPMQYRKGDEVETVSWLPRKKEVGIKPPGTRAINTVDAQGRPVTQIVEDKPGLTLPSYVKPEKTAAAGDAAKPPKSTEGEKVVDKEFAKEYNDWTSGGAESARNEIVKLNNVADALRSGQVTTGGMTGMFPDRMTTKETLRARADVESTVMNSLKAILGTAFTEKEGQRIIKATWNESDTTENNLARIERLIVDLENKASAKDDKSMYFSENGTLKGWKPSGGSSVAGGGNKNRQNAGEAFAAPADSVPTLDLNAIDAELKRRGVKAGASGGW